MQAAELPELARRLEAWFAVAQRDLDWRRTRDPYRIWVSEVMLQQTRVDTVAVYYPAFVARFPTVQALASAAEDAVLEAWSGLGYYRRARLLHRGARHVVEVHGGRMPASQQELRAIPGIGPYTAGALGAIAFDAPVPLVDGNVARVRSRLDAVREVKAQGAEARAHWQEVEALMQHGRPSVLAQALMELGATVCTPRNPRCKTCPVAPHCRALAQGRVGEIPAPKVKKAAPELHYLALALRWGERLLLERRPAAGLLGGLWCLPLVERGGEEEVLPRLFEARLGVRVGEVRGPGPAIKHVFTHRVWHLHPWTARASRRPPGTGARGGGDERRRWIVPGERPDGGIPTVTEKLLEQLGY